MSRVVVTGGAGRLGRSVVADLVARGHDVVSVDAAVPAEASWGGGPQHLRLDLADRAEVHRAFAALRPEAVVHLAAIAVPFSRPEHVILSTNTALAQHVVSAAVEHGCTRVLLASSPTVIGYGAPGGWVPRYLPLDEEHPLEPWNAYALSKQVVELVAATAARHHGDAVRVGTFRPCFVIAPEEWHGAPTQQGHTVRDRLEDPSLAAVALFNYVDARDAADFVATWLEAADDVPNASTFFVGADDALAREPLATLVPRLLPALGDLAADLRGTEPAFSSAKATRLLGWAPRRSWRTELVEPALATSGSPR